MFPNESNSRLLFLKKYMISAKGKKDYMDSFHGTKRLAGKRHSVLTAPDTVVSISFPSSLPSAPLRLPEKGPKPWLLLPFLVCVRYYKPGWVSTDPESKELHNMLPTLSHWSLPLCYYLVSFMHIHACASTCRSQRTNSATTIIVYWDWIFTSPKSSIQRRLGGQWVPGIPLSLPH